MPLVDALMKLPTVEAAAQHCIRLVAAAAVGVAVGSLVLAGIHRVTGGRLAEHAERFNLPAAALAAVLSPAQALLPFYGLAYAAMVASSLVQVAATKMKQEFATLCCECVLCVGVLGMGWLLYWGWGWAGVCVKEARCRQAPLL